MTIQDEVNALLQYYANENPSWTFNDISIEIERKTGKTITPVGVEKKMRETAEIEGKLNSFARGSLVRHLRDIMLKGWGSGDYIFDFSHAIGAWESRLPKEFSKHCIAVAEELLRQNLPLGWLPEDANDQYLLNAFNLTDFPK